MRMLVLNNNWIPVNVTGLQDAFKKLCCGRAYCLDHTSYSSYSLDEWIEISDCLDHLPKIRTGSREIAIPEVLLLDEYGKIPHRNVKYSKTNVFYRDKFKCQYCGKAFARSKLTVDHVLPKSRGGRSIWTNVVACCEACNKKKEDKTPEEAGMKLIKGPKEPYGGNPLFCLAESDRIRESWKKFLFR